MNLVRRHPIAVALIALVLWSALDPFPALVDVGTGAPTPVADLARPIAYVVFAPLSNVLDALRFLSIDRATALLGTWAVVLALWGALRRGPGWRRIGRAALGPAALGALVAATLALPRPVPRLVSTDPASTVIDYRAHTQASPGGRPGWTAGDAARWHAAQGFQAAYITDHDQLLTRRGETAIPLLPGVEWSGFRQRVLALGEVSPIDPTRYARDTRSLLPLFAELHRAGALGVVALPDYWESHWDDLDDFVRAGLDGFEVVDCAPRALAVPPAARARVIALARQHDLLIVAGSANHGWGKVTCAWNLASPSAHGYAANRVVARPLALLQGEWLAWTAAYTQPWFMFRSLSWPERVSWLTWLVVVLLYRALPRRAGDSGGIGILARALSWPSGRSALRHKELDSGGPER